MTDYKKLVRALRCKRDDCEGCDLAFFDKDEGWICQYAAKDDDAADAIEALQAQLPKLGKWIKRREFVEEWQFDGFRCSICNWWKGNFETYNYCPNCGAKMEVQE